MADAKLITVNKASRLELPMSRKIEDPWGQMVVADHILAPPYDPVSLFRLYDMSETLSQCVDAMATNVDGFGHDFEPLFDVGQGISEEAEQERKRLEAFFDNFHPEESFVTIRQKLRIDYEVLGYAFLELLRDAAGRLVGGNHIEAHTMRLCRLDPTPVTVRALVLDPNRNEYRPQVYQKRFRRFAQVVDGQIVYFKEFGDPRPMDARDGKFYEPGNEPEDFVPATEILYFRQYHPASPYGVPRWIGAILAIAGSRAAAEVNYSYFDSKAIPPVIITVSGGKMSDRAVKRIERFLQDMQGRENFHAALVIESEGGDNPLGPQESRAKIEVKELGGALLKDAVFLEYDKRNEEKIRSKFRLPKLFLGGTEEINRATAEEAHNIAEAQVFGPERRKFDHMINRRILPELGARFWRFRSRGQSQENPERLAGILERIANTGLTARESRLVMERILGISLNDPEGDGAGDVDDLEWLKYPLPVYVEMLRQGLTEMHRQAAEAQAEDAAAADDDEDEGLSVAEVEKFARKLVAIRKRVEQLEVEGVS